MNETMAANATTHTATGWPPSSRASAGAVSVGGAAGDSAGGSAVGVPGVAVGGAVAGALEGDDAETVGASG
jgi:hypothetical protein